MKKLVVVLALVILLTLAFFVLRSATPVVTIPTAVTSLGQATPISVQVRDPRGIRKLTASVEQNGTRYPLFETAQSPKSPEDTWTFTAGVKTTPQLQGG